VFVAMLLLAMMATLPTLAGAQDGIERLYVLDCGVNQGKDQSRWSPGVNEGKPIEFSDACYLIRHAKGVLLWDTGIPDAVAAMPDGMVVANGAITQRRAKTLAAQLAEIGVKPADITYVAVSHTHGDHVGNVDMFPESTLLIQKAEVDWAFAPDKRPPFKAERPMRKLDGDLDVFGDGSVTILATPGHTPGHQSLLVQLPKTGWVILSGDLAHFKDNWDNRRVASMNTSAEQTQASLKRVAELLAAKNAQLWINHDKPQSLGQKHSPEFYD